MNGKEKFNERREEGNREKGIERMDRSVKYRERNKSEKYCKLNRNGN